MNMIPTFRELFGWDFSAGLQVEAARCVRTHGCGGVGDPEGAFQILDLKAAYVSMCVSCEQARNPENILAQQLQAHFTAAFEKYNTKKSVTFGSFIG